MPPIYWAVFLLSLNYHLLAECPGNLPYFGGENFLEKLLTNTIIYDII